MQHEKLCILRSVVHFHYHRQPSPAIASVHSSSRVATCLSFAFVRQVSHVTDFHSRCIKTHVTQATQVYERVCVCVVHNMCLDLFYSERRIESMDSQACKCQTLGQVKLDSDSLALSLSFFTSLVVNLMSREM